jgi:hypothetical protein
MKKTLLIILALSFASSLSYSQINLDWVQRYNGTADSYDIVCDMIPDDSGNVFVYGTSFNTGTATDVTIIKYNSSGNITWEKKFNFGDNSYDQTRAVYKDEMNNSYICGFTNEGGSDNKIVTLKVDAMGNLVWSKIFTKENYSNFISNDIILHKGKIYIIGSGRTLNGFTDLLFICYNLEGVLQWHKNESAAQENIEAVSLVANNTDKIHIGYTVTYLTNNFTYRFSTYDLNGNFISNSGLEGQGKLTELINDNTKKLIYLSSSIDILSGNIDIRVVKTDSIVFSNIYWAKNFNGSGDNYDFPFDVCVDNQNNILVTGSSRHGDSLGTEDIVTLKYSPDGDLLWSRIYNSDSNGIDQGMSITTDAFNNVYVGGAADLGSVRLGYKILKYSPSGNLLWQDSYSYTHHPEDFVYAVRVNNRNDLFVTGISFNPGTDYDFATIKYSQNVSIENISNIIPNKFLLKQNYPNPFNPVTNIVFSISDLTDIDLRVYDINGREVETLHKGKLSAGTYKVQWNSKNLPSGVYFYKLSSNNFKEAKKMLLIK